MPNIGTIFSCRLLLALAALSAVAVPARAQQTPPLSYKGVTRDEAAWTRRFEQARDAFWKAEVHPPGVTLENVESLWPESLEPFRAAARAATAFLQLAPPAVPRKPVSQTLITGFGRRSSNTDRKEWIAPAQSDEERAARSDGRIATALYYAAISHSWLEEHAQALIYLDRLLAEYPDYRRPRMPGYPEYRRPARFDLLHLKIYHLSRLSPLQTTAPDADAGVRAYLSDEYAIEVLQSATFEANESVRLQKEWVASLEAQPDRNEKDFRGGLEIMSYTPEQRRLAFVPSLARSLATMHANHLPSAIKSSKPDDIYFYLRQFAAPQSPFRGLTRMPEAEEATRKVALALKAAGDGEFDLMNGLPQRKAYYFYRQMHEFAADPLLQGYAQFRMADAAGTLGKYKEGIQHCENAIAIWNTLTPAQRPPVPADILKPNAPNGPHKMYYIEEAYYYRNFYYGAGILDRDKGIELQRQFVELFPDSKWVEEALFDIVLWHRWSAPMRKKESAEACRVLIERLPNSKRAAVARGLLRTDYKDF